MAISKIKIQNFKSFKDLFSLSLKKGLNIIVGDNESGKSTILEAIHIALTGLYCGRNIRNELSQYLFNNEVVREYIKSVQDGAAIAPPMILIEIFFDEPINAELFEGNENTEKATKVEGLQFKIAYNEKYNDEYQKIIDAKKLTSLPIEYYEASWTTFARHIITTKSIPLKSAMIDSSSYRYQNGSDMYISRIVKDLLSPEEVTTVAQAHRNMVEAFAADQSIKDINERITSESSIVNGEVSLSVDFGTKNAWESSLITQIDNVPFGFIGKGAQCVVKTELALSHRRAQNAGIILIEEPESHLSFSNLNQLISSISQKCSDRQILMSTHSSYVANKLGLNNLILLNEHRVIRLSDLTSADFFKKMAGYDTLRLILCKRAILVEGDSDELVVQKAYMNTHDGRLPIQDGVDIISVGTSFLRFLEIADSLQKTTAVVTDNDGDISALEEKYAGYIGENQKDYIKIFYDSVVDTGDLMIGASKYNYNTLEPKMLKVNNRQLFNEIFGTEYTSDDDLRKYMKYHKTECALAIFDTDKQIGFPDYISEAIAYGE
ncbi:ATP-dependent nuclease [Congzhengia minquanensis]|uniref:AAA family ATPase n=1 Tax=Congzhengia minquanensis TaxID=2763657 RepID=A0A926DKS3_9FIRM|nr:AAA family ATPase [Congzhengia minquanensis]MBC8540091.1 AAA family ATPase [Congzhengia minquanensis]